MADTDPSLKIFDALLAAQKRGLLPTSLSTKELRELGARILGNAVFTARGTNATFVTAIKEVVDLLAAGETDLASGRLVLHELLKVLEYTPEGGFPDAPAGTVPEAVKGTLQDLSSPRRLNLILETQLAIAQGAGEKMRGSEPDILQLFPAWELIRFGSVEVARDWPARWAIAGGKPQVRGPENAGAYKVVGKPTGMIALKGDPVWGELGAWGNFSDALGVDHPPWYFNSEMGWEEVGAMEVSRLKITGPNGETPEEWLATEPVTLSGRQALPSPILSTRDIDPEILKKFEKDTGAVASGSLVTLPDNSDELERRAAEREARREARIQQTVADAAAEYARRGE